MKAAVLHAYDQPLVVEDLRSPMMGAHDIRMRVEAGGVCHSDLRVAHGELPLLPPVILGHEGAGTVLAVGTEVDRVQIGDRVVTSFVPHCGSCWHCQRGEAHLCDTAVELMGAPRGRRPDDTMVTGMMGLGTFADEITVHQTQVVAVSSELPSEQLALISCGVTTGVGAVLDTARVPAGASVTVIGCGGVGQAIVQGAVIAGASRIFAVDPVAMKRETATALGATDVIDPAEGDPVEQVRAATDGRGTDYAFEAVGGRASIMQAYDTVRRGGTAVLVGMPPVTTRVTFSAFGLFADAKTVLGCLYGSAQVERHFQRAVDLVAAGQLDVGALVTRRFPLDQVDIAFQALRNGEVVRGVVV